MALPRAMLRPAAAWHHDPVGRWLVTQSETVIAGVIRSRPDLADPAPVSLADLAARAVSRASIERCLYRLDAFANQVYEAARVAGPHSSLADVQALFVDQATTADLEHALDTLQSMALLCRSDDRLSLPVVVADSAMPAGLGPRSADLLGVLTVENLRQLCRILELPVTGVTRKADLIAAVANWHGDAEAVRARVRSAPRAVQEAALEMATGSPAVTDGSATRFRYGDANAFSTKSTSNPVQWLAAHALVVVGDWYSFVMPCEVALALRHGNLFSQVNVECPPLAVRDVAGTDVDATANTAAIDVVEAVDTLLDTWGARPADTLKSGGIGVRELKKLAQRLDRSVKDTTTIVELAALADLVTTDTRRGQALPTATSDHWLALDLPERWTALVAAWLAAPVYVGLAGTLDQAGKPRAALYDWGAFPMASDQRRVVLDALADLEPGSAPSDAAALLAPLWWRHPAVLTVGPGSPLHHLEWVLGEGTVLGVIALGALSSAGRAAVAGDLAAAAAAVQQSAGQPTTDLVLQNDLTAVVPGRTTTAFRQQMQVIADVESTGAATVYRFSEASLRRAFDAGFRADDIHQLLEAHAVKGVPQPLTYLVDDVARRYGRVQVGPAGCCVVFDEPADATAALRAKQTGKVGLRQIAPTVLVSGSAPEPVLAALRAAGFFPTQTTADGTAVTKVPDTRRARSTRTAPKPGPLPRRDTAGGTGRAGSAGSTGRAGSAGSTGRAGSAGSTGGAGGGTPADVDTLARALIAAGRPDPDVQPPAEEPTPIGDLEDLLVELGIHRSGREPVGRDPDDHSWTGGIVERPTDIARDFDAAADLLELADEESWMVRLSYTNERGKQVDLSAAVLGLVNKHVLVERLPNWKEMRIPLASIAWVRVLTEAEEERYL